MRGPEDGGTVTREKPGSPWEALGVGAPSKDQDRKELLVQEQGVGVGEGIFSWGKRRCCKDVG